MSDDSSAEIVTRILERAGGNRARSSEELLPVLYSELRKLARSLMRKAPPGNTLQPTALVHEAYVRLVGDKDPGWDGRGHFFASAARAMRRILVDQARRKGAAKHGGGAERVDIDEVPVGIEPPSTDVIALDEALRELERADPRSAEVVNLRYFAGLTAPETAAALGISLSSVERDWRFARTVLRTKLGENTDRKTRKD
jgi:RNA polymerase sigma factor (TIGR02999 family)